MSITLAHHTPEEWADVMSGRLLELGCGKAYVAAVRDFIASHTVEQAADSGARYVRRGEQ